MRILFSLTYYTPYVSGLTLYVKRLGEALVKKGHQITVLTMNFDKKMLQHKFVNGVEVVRANYLAKISKGFLSFDWIIKSWQEVQKTDLIIISLPQFEGIVPAFIGKIFGRKIISIYHCEVDLPNGIFNTVIERALTLSHFVTLALSDKIITYTKDFADHSRLLPRFRTKLSFVYPPILVPKVNNRTRKILIDKFHLEVDFVVGVAVRLAAEKGVEYLFEAIPVIHNVIARSEERATWQSHRGSPRSLQSLAMTFKIIIAGTLNPVGEEKYKEKIFKLVEKYKKHIIFLGELKEEEMGSFYSICDLLVLPSINSTEAFGMVQVEAMMMGVPVVATDLPGVRIPIADTGMGRIVPIKNSQKLAEVISEVLINKKKYIKNADLIKKKFTMGKTIEFYKNLFDFRK